MAGCATTLPPAKPIQDLRSIAGGWQGTVSSPQGSFGYTLTIKEDGSWEATSSVPVGGVDRFEGGMFVRSGKIFWVSRTTGRSGTYTLHEGEGQRVLSGRTDDGSITIRLTPVR